MMTQVPQASSKAVLLVLLVLLVAGRAAEISETQAEGQMEKRRQNQTDVMALLKSIQARLAQLETQRMILIRGMPGRPGKNGQRGPQGPQGPQGPRGPIGSIGRKGTTGPTGPTGPIGHRGDRGLRGYRGPRGDRGPGGVKYVRWGRTTCPWGASLVYKGRTGGGGHDRSGGGSNYVCLPENPRYRRYKNGYQHTAYMYGAEYELGYFNPFTRNLNQHDAPCAVCYVTTRSAKMMIPATYECPAGWTREYHGYLMSEKYYHAHSTTFICVDQDAEAVPGTKANRNGALLYPVESTCWSLPCLPYVEGRELTCAVCTK